MTPLPTLDISTPEAAEKSYRDLSRWLDVGSDLPADIDWLTRYVRAGIDMMGFKSAHLSPAAKQLVQESKLVALTSRTDERSNEPQRE